MLPRLVAGAAATSTLACACFPPRRNIIRLAPPLVIDEAQLQEATGIIKKVFSQL